MKVNYRGRTSLPQLTFCVRDKIHLLHFVGVFVIMFAMQVNMYCVEEELSSITFCRDRNDWCEFRMGKHERVRLGAFRLKNCVVCIASMICVSGTYIGVNDVELVVSGTMLSQ